ncbi:class I tRNA ligase family protein, partial [Candidatus Gottesmanbacteria bacterium]|nr:class I tRNA ligase family protein [Candidatus Gottesmanbacteria bacterium]
MDPKYDHLKVEDRIYKRWEEGGYFKPEINPGGKPYCIILPPPNANAELHLGNALFVIEDILIRFKRMRGYASLWLPGIDHAGILSQAVFEKKLLKEQEKTRYDLGREEFQKQIYKFCLD